MRWSRYPEVVDYIMANRMGKLTKELTDEVNQKFGTEFTKDQVRGFLNNRKLRSGLGKSKKGVRFVWTKETDEFLIQHKDEPLDVLVDLMNTTFTRPGRYRREYTKSAISHHKARIGARSSNDGRFVKGHAPTESVYKKGHKSDTCLPIGSERVSPDGYLLRKVSDEPYAPQFQNWRPVHRLIWEAEHGPIPDGYKVIFADGDKTNLKLENLRLVSNGESAIIMKMGVKELEPEARELGFMAAKVLAESSRRRKTK